MYFLETFFIWFSPLWKFKEGSHRPGYTVNLFILSGKKLLRNLPNSRNVITNSLVQAK